MRGLGQAPLVVQTPDGLVTCDPNVSYPEGHACTASQRFFDIEQLIRWGRLYPSGTTPPAPQTKPPGGGQPFDLMAWLKTNQTPVLVGSAVLLGASLLTGRGRR